MCLPAAVCCHPQPASLTSSTPYVLASCSSKTTAVGDYWPLKGTLRHYDIAAAQGPVCCVLLCVPVCPHVYHFHSGLPDRRLTSLPILYLVHIMIYDTWRTGTLIIKTRKKNEAALFRLVVGTSAPKQ